MVKEQDKDNAKSRENQERAECAAQASKIGQFYSVNLLQ